MNKLAYLHGYLEKKALNYQQMRRAYTKAVKPKLTRNLLARLLHWFNAKLPRTRIGFLDELRGNLGAITLDYRRTIPPWKAEAIMEQGGWLSRFISPKIHLDEFGVKHIANKYGKKIGGYKKLSPRDREVLRYVLGIHEASEIAAPPLTQNLLPFYKKYMHISPEVLMKEHNIVSTLPEEFRRVKTIMRLLRRSRGESKELANALKNNFVYGKSPMLRDMKKKVDLFKTSPIEQPLAERFNKNLKDSLL
jgi:hypothetical protein